MTAAANVRLLRSELNGSAPQPIKPTSPPMVTFDGSGKGAPKLVLPQAPALDDVAAQCEWLTVVFNLNPEHPITGGTHAGVRGQDGHVMFTRQGAPEIRFEPAGRLMKPDRLTETLEAWGQPYDGQVYGYKGEHCRQINHVARMLYGRSEALSVEQETAGIVSVYVQSAEAVEGFTTYGNTVQRYEAATALQRELDAAGRPIVAPRYLIDQNTGELVIRLQDLGDAARRFVGSTLARGWLDGRMISLGWQRITIDGHEQPGRAGRSGPHARCYCYRGLVAGPPEEGTVTT